MKGKLDFKIRMWDASLNRCEETYPATTLNQALMIAMSAPANEKYLHFGLVGRDGGCHVWKHRRGAPHINPERMAASTHALTATAPTVRPKDAKARDPRILSEPTKPIVIETVSVEKLTEITMQSALPQLPARDAFTAREIGTKLPHENQHQWTPEVWPHVISRLRSSGVLLKLGTRHAYMRNPEHVGKKLVIDEDPPATVARTNGHGAAPAVPEAVATPLAAAAPEPLVAEPVPDLPPLLSIDDKIEGILTFTQALLSDTRQREQTFKSIADRIVDIANVVEGALQSLDQIRADLKRAVQAEAALPTRATELVTKWRRTPVGSTQAQMAEAPH